jgi:hypothetical protein
VTRAIVVRSNAASVVVESEIVAAMGSSDFLEAGFTGADYGSAFRRVLPDIAMMLRVDTLPGSFAVREKVGSQRTPRAREEERLLATHHIGMPLIVSVNLPPILRQNGNHTPFATGDRQFESISLLR